VPPELTKSTLPIWTQAVLQAVKDNGVTAVIAGFLVYVFATTFAGDLRGMRAEGLVSSEEATASATEIKRSIQDVSTDLKRHLAHDAAALQALRIICISVANDEQAQRDCIKTQ
jgi:hypothetical protein